MHTHSQAGTDAAVTPNRNVRTDPPSWMLRSLRALTLVFAAAVTLLGVQETALAQTAQWAVTVTDSNGNPTSRIVEGGGPITITATVTNGVPYTHPQGPIITWGNSGVSLSDSLLLGADGFSAIPITPGDTSGSLEIYVNDDDLYAPTETRALTIHPLGASISAGNLTYVDNEQPPTASISVSPNFVNEKGENAFVRVTLSHGYTQDQRFEIADMDAPDDTFLAGDFNAQKTKWFAEFAAGERRNKSAAGAVIPHDTDNNRDGREVTFDLIPKPNLYRIGSRGSATLTILDTHKKPSAPRHANAVAGDGQVQLTWAWPEKLTLLNGYQYRSSGTDGTSTGWTGIANPPRRIGDTHRTASLAKSHVVTGLTNGVAYTFDIRAVNNRGGSDWVSAWATPTAPRIVISDTSVTEGGSTEISITPDGAPFTGGKNVTLVIAKAGGIPGNFEPDDDFTVRDVAYTSGENAPTTRRSFTAPANASSLSGRQAHYTTFMLPNFTNVTMRITTQDDSFAECRERYFVFAYTDYGNANQQRIAASANDINSFFIDDDDGRGVLESSTLDGSTVTLTFDRSLSQRSPPGPGEPEYDPNANPAHHYFTLFTETAPGEDDGSGMLATSFSMSGRTVSLTFPEAVPAGVEAWVRYDNFSKWAPLGTPRSGQCGQAMGEFTKALGEGNALPVLTIGNAQGTEGEDASIDFPATLNRASTETISVDYRTFDAGAVAGSDYTTTSGTLTFTPGETAKTISVPIIDDTTEDNDESFYLQFYNPSGATIVCGNASGPTCVVRGRIYNSEDETEAPENSLTASFANVPVEHGGGGESNRFTFDLSFSENPQVGYAKLRDHAFTITGGDVKKAQRKVRGSNQSWTITVEPDGWGNVSLTLPGGRACTASGAICTADARQLSNSPSATVIGPAALSVADASADESTDDTLDFVVSLDRSSTLTVTVDYATSNGTATAGSDYTPTSGELTFEPGNTTKTVSVPILNDAIDDDGETVTLTLSNASNARIADGTATGTIANSDPIPQAWLARFGRTVADHVVDAVAARLEGSSGGGSQVTLGGQRIPLDGAAKGAAADGAAAAGKARDALAAFADRVSGGGAEDGTGWARWGVPGGEDAAKRRESRGLTEREMLLGSSFLLAAGGDGANASGMAWTAWGRAAASRFDGNADGLAVDGDVTTFTLGADAARGRWLGGVALAHSTGEGGFRDHADTDHAGRSSGELESTLTSVHPYLRFRASERLTLWGVLGYGTGDLSLAVDAAGDNPRKTWKTDTGMGMAATGARGVLLSAADHEGFELAARGDARLVRMNSDAATGADGAGSLAATESETSRVRFVLEGSHRFDLAGGQTLTPTLEVGLRHDGGDAETGTGVEIGGGLTFADPAWGLTVTAKARGLLTHEDSDYTEWGANGLVRIDPGVSGHGLSVTLTPAWGADTGGAERLWGLRDARGLAGNENVEPAGRLDAEAGWGFEAFGGRGLMTPFAGLTLSEEGDRSWRTGVRWTLQPDLSLGVEATLREAANDNPGEHGVAFRFTVRW